MSASFGFESAAETFNAHTYWNVRHGIATSLNRSHIPAYEQCGIDHKSVSDWDGVIGPQVDSSQVFRLLQRSRIDKERWTRRWSSLSWCGGNQRAAELGALKWREHLMKDRKTNLDM
jgi:hypothetical protein